MKKNKIKFEEEFKQYCKTIAQDNNIDIINENKWYITIKMKGWNQYQKVYELYIKYRENDKGVKSSDLIDLYLINIRVRNTLYEYSLLIEEYIKSFLHYGCKKKDWIKLHQNKKGKMKETNELTISKLIDEIKKNKYQDKILKEINGQDFKFTKKALDYFKDWNWIRNKSCHRENIVILGYEDLKCKIMYMMHLLNNSINYEGNINNCCCLGFRDKFINKFNKALSIKTEDETIIKIIDNFTIKTKTN